MCRYSRPPSFFPYHSIWYGHFGIPGPLALPPFIWYGFKISQILPNQQLCNRNVNTKYNGFRFRLGRIP